MQLIFRSPRGETLLDWSEYALLRDNVQHYLESGPIAGEDDQPLRTHIGAFVAALLSITERAATTDDVSVTRVEASAP